ncbi:hypothetical protein G4V62_14560 [Bacillaceae bacterium SIJ1]|uniref:hypothetical protein n=1 Tax=Litoribacterium kuwaitense TaxID=1398745 RepID=UPI0013EA06A0|nr:hypothetical protein [Litoribacterium kuwaitense]NGP46114.1 hypothetical protein [Litoribacterium kuwaitense]
MKQMNHFISKVVPALILVLFSGGLLTPSAMAQENQSTTEILDGITKQYLEELRDFNNENNPDVAIHDFELTVDEEKLMKCNFDPEAIKKVLYYDFEKFKEEFQRPEWGHELDEYFNNRSGIV